MGRINSELIENKIKIDTKDKKILDLLSENSRMPISAIAKKVELGRDTTAYRVKRFEKLGAIELFYPKIDYKRLGFNTYHFLFSLKGNSRKEEFIKELINLGNVLSIMEYTDKWDLEVVMVARNVKELDILLTDFEQKFENYIEEVEKLLEIVRYQSILFGYHFNKNIKKINQKYEEKESYYIPDKIDFEILNLICEDCRKSTYEIARELPISADSVGIRIKRLHEERIIRKFTVLANLSLLNFAWRTVLIKTKSFTRDNEKKFRNFIELNPNVKGAAKTFGDYDILMYLISDGRNKYHQTFHDLRNNFPGIIRVGESLVAYKELYFNAFPKIIYEQRINY